MLKHKEEWLRISEIKKKIKALEKERCDLWLKVEWDRPYHHAHPDFKEYTLLLEYID
jgi:hypothetical protein